MDNTFLQYNALDSACMLEAHNSFWPTLEKEGYLQTYKLTLDLFPVLQFMQEFGMKVNLSLLEETKTEVLAEIDVLQKQLNELVGRVLNVNSSKECILYFYGEMGIPPITNRKTKKLSSDNLAMQRIARGTAKIPGMKQAQLVQHIRGLQKLYNTYLNMSFDEDMRMRGSYNPRGTKFGRLSSSKTIRGTGMNFQNLPQEFKKFLVADDGYVLVEVDKRQAEWVVVAYLSGDANMIQAIESGIDVHVHTASLMFTTPKSVIVRENQLIGHSTDAEKIEQVRVEDPEIAPYVRIDWPKTVSLRQCGKKSNHGLNYDEGYKNFALINSMEEREAKRIVDLYHTIYPGIRIMYNDIRRQLQKDRSLTNCFGRKIAFMGDMCRDMLKSAYSALPQSTVVDSVNQGMVNMYSDKFLTKKCNINILAQVHDSILFEVPKKIVQDKNRWEEIETRIYGYLTPELYYNGRTFRIKNDIKMGNNWGEHGKTNPGGMRDITTFEDIEPLLSGE